MIKSKENIRICGETTLKNCSRNWLILEFLDKNNTVTKLHAPYFPEIVLCDVLVYLKMKKKSQKYNVWTTLQREEIDSLKELNALQNIAFHKFFEDYKKHQYKSIIPDGDYFEKVKINIDEWIKIFGKQENAVIFWLNLVNSKKLNFIISIDVTTIFLQRIKVMRLLSIFWYI